MKKRNPMSFLIFMMSLLTLSVFQNCGQPLKTRALATNGSSASSSEGKALCTDPDDVGVSRNLRLAKHQYINTLTDLFGTSILQNSNVISALSVITSDGGARNSKYFDSSLTSEHVQNYVDVAFEIAQTVFSNSSAKVSVFGSCASLSTIPSTCIDGYLSGFASKIFRRPLKPEEVVTAKSLYAKSIDPKEGLMNVLALHLSSPHFLLLIEVGNDSDTRPHFQISDYEIASRLSYALTDSTPDDLLLSNAKSGQLKNDDLLKDEARRLAITPNGRNKIIQMFHGWLETSEFFDYSSLGAQFLQGLNTSGLDAAATSEMNQFLDYIIFTQNGSYKDLMTSKLSFAKHAGLASIHGHAPISSAPISMISGRQGILGRMPYLFSGTTRSNIILRGVAFRRNILCQNLPSPPSNIIDSRQMTDLTEAEILNLSNREWTHHRTSSMTCIGCHSLINPTGFSFEIYDSIGRLRTQESIYDSSFNFVGTKPIDSSADVPWGQDIIRVKNANDLTYQVSTSLEGQACLGKNIYEFTHSREADARDGCQLNETSEPLQISGGSILDSFIRSSVNRGIRWKRIQ